MIATGSIAQSNGRRQSRRKIATRLLAICCCFAGMQTPLVRASDQCDLSEYCDAAPEPGSLICSCQDGCSDLSMFELRKGLADSGITFANNLTQFYFGTVGGGVEQADRYGGHGDYMGLFDLGKMGLSTGTFIKIRAEHNFGQSISPLSGVFLPPTLATDLPIADSRDLYLTNFLVTQFFSERFGIYAGKLDTLDGDTNAYAAGRGVTQFSNTAFIANPIALRTIPYSSLGCGFLVMNEGEPLFNFLVINPRDTTDESGFDELFADGVAMSAELRVPTNFAGLPGHQLVGATWSNREYIALDQDPRIILPNVPIARTNGSESIYWNMDQALWVDDCDPTRHWGYFARAGISEDDANPVHYLLSAGLGGASLLRRGDTFGLGYYYTGVSEEIAPILQAVLGPIDDGQGVELFYQYRVSQSLTITPDFQWLDPARQLTDDAYILGLRANLAF